jgi:hypothetical protein
MKINYMRVKFTLEVALSLLLCITLADNIFADIAFTDATLQSGIDNPAKGSCVAFVDYNSDGYMDIYVGNNGILFEPLGRSNILYRNNGDGTFTDVSVEAGVADERQAQGVAFGDFDNDGDPDLYVANDFGINALYRNNGNGVFEDIAEAADARGGIDIAGGEEIPNGYGVALADIDNDNSLDIYVVNLGSANILYQNNGDNTFTDVTSQWDVKAGLGPQSAGTAAVFSDFDGDGKVDLYAANGYGLPSFFYINSDGSFKDATGKAGVGELDDVQGAVSGDYDNDGDMDIYVTNFADAAGAPLPNALFRNDGKGVFEDVTQEAGVGGEDYSLGAAFGDLDNDGYLDLYVVNNGGPNVLYRNNGDGTFSDVTGQAGVGDEGFGSNAALGDLNNDGYLDIYLANSGFSDDDMGNSDVLYMNNGGDNHWLQLSLQGTMSNKSGIGARVSVSTADGARAVLHQMREISGGRGYAQDSPVANFGLGEHEAADVVEVVWPSGLVQTLNNVKADQLVVIVEGEVSVVQPSDKNISSWGKVKDGDNSLAEREQNSASPLLEQNYPNPFNPETWIPYRLSQDSQVNIVIYDSMGLAVRELNLGYQKAGLYLSQDKAAYWDGRNSTGEYVSSGVYFYRIKAGNFVDMRKMLLIR